MNNAWTLDELEETKPTDTSAEQARLVRIIEAIDELVKNDSWRTLQELCFSREEERINRLLLTEAKETAPDLTTIHQLQGELQWAKRYGNLVSYAQLLKNQLEKLKHE